MGGTPLTPLTAHRTPHISQRILPMCHAPMFLSILADARPRYWNVSEIEYMLFESKDAYCKTKAYLCDEDRTPPPYQMVRPCSLTASPVDFLGALLGLAGLRMNLFFLTSL